MSTDKVKSDADQEVSENLVSSNNSTSQNPKPNEIDEGAAVEELVDQFLDDDPEVRSMISRKYSRQNTKQAESVRISKPKKKARKVSNVESDEFDDIHGARKAPPPVNRRSRKPSNNRNYSQEFYDGLPPERTSRRKNRSRNQTSVQSSKKKAEQKKPPIPRQPSKDNFDDVSLPDGYVDEDFEEEKERQIKAAAERKKNNDQFIRASRKQSRPKSKNFTKILGTARYNPFAFGSQFGSAISSFNSMTAGTFKKKNMKKALYGDNPYKLRFVRGYYKMMRAGDIADDLSDLSFENNRKPTAIDNFLANFRRMGNKAAPKNIRNSMLSKREIDYINKQARQSQMAELTPEEIRYIEERMEKEGRANIQKKGCYGFVSSCFEILRGKRSEKAKNGGHMEELPLEGLEELSFIEPPEEGSPGQRSSAKKTSGQRPICKISGATIRKKDGFVQEGNAEGGVDYFLSDCIECELCRKSLGGRVTLEMREEGSPVVCNTCQRNVEETREAQARLLTNNPYTHTNEYWSLVPRDTVRFVPLVVEGQDEQDTIGFFPMCSTCGVQFTKKDKDIVQRDMKRFHATCPSPAEIKVRLTSDVKTVAVGLPKNITLNVLGSSALLNDPLSQMFTFQKDNASLQYELRQNIKNGLPVVYNLLPEERDFVFALENIKSSMLMFEAQVVDEVGPFCAGQKVLLQEQDMRVTDNSLILRGRFEHGILYDLIAKFHFNGKKNILTPVALEVTLKVPNMKNL